MKVNVRKRRLRVDEGKEKLIFFKKACFGINEPGSGVVGGGCWWGLLLPI